MSTVAQYLPSLEQVINQAAKCFLNKRHKSKVQLKAFIQQFSMDKDILDACEFDSSWLLQMNVRLQAYSQGPGLLQRLLIWFSDNNNQGSEGLVIDTDEALTLQVGSPGLYRRLTHKIHYYPLRILFEVNCNDHQEICIRHQLILEQT